MVLQPRNGQVQLHDVKTFVTVLLGVKDPQMDNNRASASLSNETIVRNINNVSQLDKIGSLRLSPVKYSSISDDAKESNSKRKQIL